MQPNRVLNSDPACTGRFPLSLSCFLDSVLRAFAGLAG